MHPKIISNESTNNGCQQKHLIPHISSTFYLIYIYIVGMIVGDSLIAVLDHKLTKYSESKHGIGSTLT